MEGIGLWGQVLQGSTCFSTSVFLLFPIYPEMKVLFLCIFPSFAQFSSTLVPAVGKKKVYAHFPKYFSLFLKITILCVCSPIMKIKLMLTNSAS